MKLPISIRWLAIAVFYSSWIYVFVYVTFNTFQGHPPDNLMIVWRDTGAYIPGGLAALLLVIDNPDLR